jgi:hypothetical protein
MPVRPIATPMKSAAATVAGELRSERGVASVDDPTHEVTITPRDSVRAGIAPGDPIVRAGVAHFGLELDQGRYTVVNSKDPDPGEGTYSVYRGRIEITMIDGTVLTARWSFEDGKLRFKTSASRGLREGPDTPAPCGQATPGRRSARPRAGRPAQPRRAGSDRVTRAGRAS